jgi:hypothetical protein
MKKLVIAIGLILFAAIPSVAQQERYIDVGVDGTGRQVWLDRNSIDKSRKLFILIGEYGDGFTFEQYVVNCQNRTYSMVNLRLYDGNQNLITSVDEPTRLMVHTVNSPVGQGAAIVCSNKP